MARFIQNAKVIINQEQKQKTKTPTFTLSFNLCNDDDDVIMMYSTTYDVIQT